VMDGLRLSLGDVLLHLHLGLLHVVLLGHY
jgi:hypothetical protein